MRRSAGGSFELLAEAINWAAKTMSQCAGAREGRSNQANVTEGYAKVGVSMRRSAGGSFEHLLIYCYQVDKKGSQCAGAREGRSNL